ncbi:hypothetical protein [Ramlibacter sp.]|uniref:hypothetical protein n=1 Tax=Ramlibacter sp. TaxID=1917967 RepID=UPI002FC80A4D
MANRARNVRIGLLLVAAAAAPAAAADCLDPVARATRVMCGAWLQPAGEWHLHLGGASIHDTPTRAPGRVWNEQHPGVGFEVRLRGLPWRSSISGDPWQTSYTLGSFSDSRRAWSLYGGSAFTREVMRIGATRVDAGAGVFMFYRSRSWSGRMAWVPAVMPVMSITDPNGPVGFNVLWRPPGFDGPSTFFFQITHRFPS